MSAKALPEEACRRRVRAALVRIEHMVELHIVTGVFEVRTARAVVQECNEQFAPLLGKVAPAADLRERHRTPFGVGNADAVLTRLERRLKEERERNDP
jgi:hypothetical protein